MSINALKTISKPYLKTTNPLSKKWYVCFKYTNNQKETKEFKRTFDLNQSPFVIKGVINDRPKIQKERYNLALKYVNSMEDLINTVEFDTNRGVFVEDARQKPLKDYINEWLEWKKYQVKESSYQTYKDTINVFIRYLVDTQNENISLQDFDYQFLYTFLINVQDTVSNSRRNYYLTIFINFFKYIIDIQEIDIPNPTKKIAKIEVDDTAKHAKYSDVQQAITDLIDYNYYLGFMAKCVYYTLHRIETLTALQFKDFDLKNALIHIPSTKVKNRKKQTIRISKHLLPILKDYVKANPPQQNDYFFGYNGKIKNSKGGKKLDINMFGKYETSVGVFSSLFTRFKVRKKTNKDLFTINHTLYGFKHNGYCYYKEYIDKDGNKIKLSDEEIIKITGHKTIKSLAYYSRLYNAVIDEELFSHF